MGLNPCFSGGWSRRRQPGSRKNKILMVLILVLVEDGLGAGFAGEDGEVFTMS